MVAELFVSQRPTCILCGGKNMAGFDCTCAAEAMWLFRASQGTIATTSCHVRDLTNDCDGGTNLRQMSQVSDHYGITTGKLYQPIDSASVFGWVATHRYGAIFDGSYAPLVGTAYDRFHGSFRGNHAFYLSDAGRTPGTTRTGDPGGTNFIDIPNELLKRSGQQLDLGGPPAEDHLDPGKCYAYLTPADPPTPVDDYIVSLSGTPGKVGTYTHLYRTPNGVPDGSVSRASYLCSRSRIGGLWWYRILRTGAGKATQSAGLWFKPNRYTKGVPA